jgi:hypothetical protein
MSNNFAILIDGGFVRKKLESRIGNRIHRMTEEQLDCLINEIIEEFTLLNRPEYFGDSLS